MKPHAFVFLIFLFILGCGGPLLIDGSTPEALSFSVEAMLESLEESKKKEFNEALQVVMFSKMNIGELMQSKGKPNNPIDKEIMAELNGKTAEEVIELSKAITEKRKIEAEKTKKDFREKMRKANLPRIKEYEERLKKIEESREQLSRVFVLNAKFYIEKKQFSSEPKIDVKVRNGLQSAISRIYFEGTVSSPNRSVPWIQEGINYTIPGGLEPNEEAKWDLYPNSFSKWGSTKVPPEATLSLKVVRVDGPNGEELFSSEPLSDLELRDFNRLKKENEEK